MADPHLYRSRKTHQAPSVSSRERCRPKRSCTQLRVHHDSKEAPPVHAPSTSYVPPCRRSCRSHSDTGILAWSQLEPYDRDWSAWDELVELDQRARCRNRLGSRSSRLAEASGSDESCQSDPCRQDLGHPDMAPPPPRVCRAPG